MSACIMCVTVYSYRYMVTDLSRSFGPVTLLFLLWPKTVFNKINGEPVSLEPGKQTWTTSQFVGGGGGGGEYWQQGQFQTEFLPWH